MSDLSKYIAERKKRDLKFAKNYEQGYNDFKIGVTIKNLRTHQNITQEELARKLNTKKPAISRIENHAENITLSMLDRIVDALGKKLVIQIV